ncbi:unnamed protein product [Oncorhynchus mykiss]|uniref:Tetratricopeptide repeat protein 28 n=1 Tax=Oncorhynchus mykiss TaxID=8022 RepID=A0A060WGQ7_ONCMY|nr:unnamed protein product [Oncorhynchus mykiss]
MMKWQPRKKLRLTVSSDHFVVTDYKGDRLKQGSVPTVFPPWTGKLQPFKTSCSSLFSSRARLSASAPLDLPAKIGSLTLFFFLEAYFRQGVALQYLGRHADALAAFASGLAQDPKSLQLLVGMVEAAMKSPLRESLEPTYQQLQKMKLDKSPFVVVSVIGQELLTAAHHTASVVVLESALKIGTCSLKLRGSVFSALSSAHWSLGNTEKSTGYMQQDLEVSKTLGDQTGECRAHGNLGSAFFSKGNYREALTNHRHQLVLAMKLKDREVRD